MVGDFVLIAVRWPQHFAYFVASSGVCVRPKRTL